MNKEKWKKILQIPAVILAVACALGFGYGLGRFISRPKPVKTISSQSIVLGKNHQAALQKDGTVIATGLGDDASCAVEGWTDVVSVDAGTDHTVGLRSDGTVLVAGSKEYDAIRSWTQVVKIEVVSTQPAALRTDGTMIVDGNNGYGQCDVQDWTDIKDFALGVYNTVGLKKDGTVIAEGRPEELFVRPTKEVKAFLQEESGHLPDTGVNIQLFFTDESSDEPVITMMARELSVDFSICWGKLEDFRSSVYGSLVININEKDKDRVLAYLDSKKVISEVL